MNATLKVFACLISLAAPALRAQSLPLVWSRTVNLGSTQDDYFYRLARDADNNVVTAGWISAGVNGTGDMVVAKYAADGTQLWLKTYHGRTNADDHPFGIGCDAAGNVYVVGTSSIGSNHGEVVLLKYEPDGDLAWQRFESSGGPNSWTGGHALAVDSNGNTAFTTARPRPGYTNQEIWVLSYDSAGSPRWARGGFTDVDISNFYPDAGVTDLCFGPDGTVYLCGFFNTTGASAIPTPGWGAVSSSGTLLWAKLIKDYYPPHYNYGGATDIGVGPDGGVYVCGYEDRGTTPSRGFLFRLNPATGAAIWNKDWYGSFGAQIFGLTFDQLGHVITVGRGPGGYLIQWNCSDGAEQWRRTYTRGPGDQFFRLAGVNSVNNIYLVGFTYSQPNSGAVDNTKRDVTILRYNNAGVQLDVTHFNGAAASGDYPNALLMDPSDHIYVAAASGGSGSGADAVLLKYRGEPNLPPVAGDFEFDPPSAIEFDVDVLAHASDPNNDPLSIVSVSNVVGGSAVVANGGTMVRFTADPFYAGNPSFTYTVNDVFGGSASGTVSLLPVFTPREQWRLHHFDSHTNTGDAADDADPDGDGQNNDFEYAAGIVPTDSLSRFRVRVEAVPGQPTHKAIIYSPLVSGRTYTLHCTASLSEPAWSPLIGYSATDDGSECTIIDLDADEPERFYRVEIVKP